METDEPYLRPCKQLPSSTYDRQAPHTSMGQYLGVQSSSQGHGELGNCDSSPSLGQDDTEDETSEYEHGSSNDASECVAHETSEAKVAHLLKGKEKECTTAVLRKGPLRLLDLPLDILKIIFKEVTHTNDLANCAKVNSILHSLVTPMIYSRFDIVWPETQSSAESSRGVDALTYGLATLVMREDLFATVTYPNSTLHGVTCQSVSCPHCGSVSYLNKDADNNARSRISRRGNYFSQFVKKFSLGNGPTDWVQEYLVTKESGKMLGTLVALSVARMPNLETFIWDMPTGVLRDIWIALSSLGDYRQSKLEKLWIRLHDNHAALKDAGLLQPAGTTQTPQGIPLAAIAVPPTQQSSLIDPERYGVRKLLWADNHVETPNFSIMPSLSSLTVLNIDEVKYLQELAILLARSLATLRELRIGMATTLNIPPSVQQSLDATPLFQGGVIALLMSRIYDQVRPSGSTNKGSSKSDEILKENTRPAGDQTETAATSANPNWPISQLINMRPRNVVNDDQSVPMYDKTDAIVDTLVSQVAAVSFDVIDPALVEASQSTFDKEHLTDQYLKENTSEDQKEQANAAEDRNCLATNESSATAFAGPMYTAERLKLEVLEIERITKLSPQVLSKAIDFTVLTSLTLLHCGDCSSLWDRLRREFAPRISRSTLGIIQKTNESSPQSHSRRKQPPEQTPNDVEYRLRLRRIFTDAVSSDLISFLKTTLAPNSLEWLFLRDTEVFPSPVTLEAIYRGPIRRHRSSLTKVMIDSAYGSTASRSRINSARKWMLNRDTLSFITSGKMCKLRELAFALEYKDWHFFLQRLPNIPHLRSFYIPNMSDHPYGNSLKVRDFALGAIDVVALRPEVELCYLGIKDKCFEISEKTVKDGPKGKATSSTIDPTSDEDTEDGDHHDDEDEDSEDGGAAPQAPAVEPGAMDSDTGSITTEEEDEGGDGVGGKKRTKLRLRDILFYDDKISVFKARHGRL